jgi:hypothetical protein
MLGMIALVVALGGSSFALEQAQKAGKKGTLRTRIGGATNIVKSLETVPGEGTNSGRLFRAVGCPVHPKLGKGIAYAGGVENLGSGDLEPLEEKTDYPWGGLGQSRWGFQFDNDTPAARAVRLKVLCIFPKLNTKRDRPGQ